tara:strand:- start:479 stop:808 length:330 start_codon:yes stop_codon:yes gene_type:complete
MKKIPIKKRNEVILIAKKIISFCKSNGNINRSLFESLDEVIEQTKYISDYGDFSSVRRAIRLINEAYELNIECSMSNETEKKLDIKSRIKEYSCPTLQIARTKVFVSFD